MHTLTRRSTRLDSVLWFRYDVSGRMRGYWTTREIIERLGAHGMSASEIASALGVSRQTVYDHLARIRERVRTAHPAKGAKR